VNNWKEAFVLLLMAFILSRILIYQKYKGKFPFSNRPIPKECKFNPGYHSGDGRNNQMHGKFYSDAIRDKEYPLWNPYILSGMPSYTNGLLFLPQGNEGLPYVTVFIAMLFLTIWVKYKKESLDDDMYIAIGVLVYAITSVVACLLKYCICVFYGKGINI